MGSSSSEQKYDSGTGWPSFFAPLVPANLGTKQDVSLFSARTEVHCAKVCEVEGIETCIDSSFTSAMPILDMSSTMVQLRPAFATA